MSYIIKRFKLIQSALDKGKKQHVKVHFDLTLTYRYSQQIWVVNG